jgi:ribose-phosphate pyrophosphokinase
MKNIKIIGGSSNPKLVNDVAKLLRKKPLNNIFEYFANTEFRPRIPESVRGKDIFVLQTGGYSISQGENGECRTANDYLMEAYILTKTLRRSDAKTINLILPFFPYSREDKKDNPRGAISARDVADLFELARVNRVITFDLHAPQIQGFFNAPCDNLYTTYAIKDYLDKKIFKKEKNYKDKFVLVAPDEGALKRIKEFASLFQLPFLVLSKERDYSKKNMVEKTVLIGNKKYLQNRTAIIIDDMIDTFGTVNKATEVIKRKGAKDLIVCATHGIFSGPALELINKNSFIKMVLVSDTIPQHIHLKLSKKIKVFTIAPMVADIIRRLSKGQSVSGIFSKN